MRCVCAILVLCLTSSCRFVFDLDDFEREADAALVVDGGVVDGNGDDTDSGEPCSWPVTPIHFDPCLLEVDPKPLSLSVPGTYLFDTDTSMLHHPASEAILVDSEVVTVGDIQVRVISTDSFSLPGDAILRAEGSLGLVILSWSTIDVYGTIDVSSRRSMSAGAGARTLAQCMVAVGGRGGDSSVNGGGGGGGGGGGHAKAGGAGGSGDPGGGGGDSGPGGSEILNAQDVLGGGCPGGSGGVIDDERAAGGSGGGVIQLTARESVTVEGKIRAGGAGGEGGTTVEGGGGGGGGSGGLIGLAAPSITIDDGALMTANGGGGGGGYAALENGGPGQDGGESAASAAGGNAGGNGGPGGAGGAGADSAGGEGESGVLSALGGGGGGGGAAGFVLHYSDTILVRGGAQISPQRLAITP